MQTKASTVYQQQKELLDYRSAVSNFSLRLMILALTQVQITLYVIGTYKSADLTDGATLLWKILAQTN